MIDRGTGKTDRHKQKQKRQAGQTDINIGRRMGRTDRTGIHKQKRNGQAGQTDINIIIDRNDGQDRQP